MLKMFTGYTVEEVVNEISEYMDFYKEMEKSCKKIKKEDKCSCGVRNVELINIERKMGERKTQIIQKYKLRCLNAVMNYLSSEKDDESLRREVKASIEELNKYNLYHAIYFTFVIGCFAFIGVYKLIELWMCR